MATADADEDDGRPSLSAMEEQLKPQVLENFDRIEATYVKLHKLQDQRLTLLTKGESPTKASDTKYDKLKSELVALMEDVHLNNGRIEQLVEQLYILNRTLVGYEGRLLRYATDSRIDREAFLDNYFNHELDPSWLDRVAKIDFEMDALRRPLWRGDHRHPHPDRRDRGHRRASGAGIPAHRLDRPEGREGGEPGEEGDGRGQSPPRHLDRQEIHQSRPAVSRPDPGRAISA